MPKPAAPLYRTTNWSAYNAALKRRGSLEIWFDPEMTWLSAPCGQTWIPPMRSKAERVPLKAGDSVSFASPGGGGFGDPLTRDLAAVEEDLNAGLISRATAEAAYGVTITTAVQNGDRMRYTVAREKLR